MVVCDSSGKSKAFRMRESVMERHRDMAKRLPELLLHPLLVPTYSITSGKYVFGKNPANTALESKLCFGKRSTKQRGSSCNWTL